MRHNISEIVESWILIMNNRATSLSKIYIYNIIFCLFKVLGLSIKFSEIITIGARNNQGIYFI